MYLKGAWKSNSRVSSSPDIKGIIIEQLFMTIKMNIRSLTNQHKVAVMAIRSSKKTLSYIEHSKYFRALAHTMSFPI